jgi:hypothetical protein
VEPHAQQGECDAVRLQERAGSIEQRRFDALRLLRQVPAITELAQLPTTTRKVNHSLTR